MAFHITKIQTATFPSEEAVHAALASFGLSLSSLQAALEGFVCEKPVIQGEGYQQVLAHEIKLHLDRLFSSGGTIHLASNYYSPRLNEKADLALGKQEHEQNIFFEVEFRPNVEKDLIKFQIGYNCRRLAAGVLILPVDRAAINPSYTTMPEFKKFIAVIKELSPPYPLIVLGIIGQHVTENPTS